MIAARTSEAPITVKRLAPVISETSFRTTPTTPFAVQAKIHRGEDGDRAVFTRLMQTCRRTERLPH
jgi:hypothetical protein